jgi:hypothetical protein
MDPRIREDDGNATRIREDDGNATRIREHDGIGLYSVFSVELILPHMHQNFALAPR